MSTPQTFNPATLAEALALLSQAPESTVVLAGGTDLLVQLRDRPAPPERILHIGRIEELRGIREGAGQIRIGSLTTHSDLVRLQEAAGWGTLLAKAAGEIGSVQIRNQGTIGGNLVNASPAADLIPPLLVLEARLVLHSSRGPREVPLRDFCTGPGQNRRGSDEILTSVVFPRPPAGQQGLFLKLGQRRAQAIAKVTLALWYQLEGTALREVRLALGAVAPTVVRAPRTEALLAGRSLTAGLVARASRSVMEEVRPIGDLRSSEGYRRQMCGALVARALESLLPA